ncbi:Mu transposase domain-containing protein [Succinivibrio sp.]|uniref:Mu transposase domain-containing protein n=1 Tax=Succinivibrio sp. TaxID=2053619 RepID=UPI0038698EAF
MGEPISVVVPGSYMVTVQAHQYSVPYLYIKKRVDIYLTNDLVIIKRSQCNFLKNSLTVKGSENARNITQNPLVLSSYGLSLINAT